MIIRKNIKSKVESRPIKSLSRKKSKSDLSFYSSIERDIRDIEMRLYRIKKALKYYSEDSSGNTIINNPDKFVRALDFDQLRLTSEDKKEIQEAALDETTMSRRRKDYSIFMSRKRIKEETEKILQSETNKQRLQAIQVSFKKATNEQQLANAINELLSFIHDLKVQFVESIWKRVSSFSRFLFICGGITLAIIEIVFPGAIGEIGKTIYGNPGNLDAIGIAFTGIFILTLSSGVLSLLAGRAAKENREAQQILRQLEDDYIKFLGRTAENIVKVKLTPQEFQKIKEYMFAGSKEVVKQEHIREGRQVENLLDDLEEIDRKVRFAMNEVEKLINSKLN